MKLRPHAIAIAVGVLFAGPRAWAQAEDHGKRVDNGRIDVREAPPPTEVQPAFAYPLPSGVSREEALAMRRQAAGNPASAAALSHTIAETNGLGLFESGKADLTPAARAALDALAGEIKSRQGRKSTRISIVGHTDNQRLAPDTKRLFGDNQRLSEARALAVAAYLKKLLDDPSIVYAVEGKGETRPVASNANPHGMSRNRRVDIRVWLDVEAAAPAAPPTARAAAPACAPVAESQADAPLRITIDGEPMDLSQAPNEADRQRCTDVALEKADIQVRYDPLAIAPAMNVWATPNSAVRGEEVRFRAWSNYIPWIRKAELRLFREGQRPQETPLAVMPMSWNGPVSWKAPAVGSDDQVYYLLRVYDAQGRFDETSLKPLHLVTHAPARNDDPQQREREQLTGYGENSLALRNIPVSGGTVTVNGSHLKAGQRIEALGLELPVDPQGRFAIKQIMHDGPNTVAITLKEADGRSLTFRRNLDIASDDWFYVAVGDLTIGRNSVAGPAQLVTADTDHYDDKVYIDGRAAFYLKGKVKGDWLLTASADTREQPVADLFRNFSSKDPRYLLRNIDPNRYYPVYGDDSTVVDDAPTQGKFYVRLQKEDSHVMWGNFQTTWSGTELMQYSRGLYGAQARYRSDDSTAHGERRTRIDAFAAEPGTLAAREEFRGTGGSLYYLHHLDITQGSERVWVEVRDKDSGMVLERRALTPVQDYDINYLQGRILLQSPLSMVGASSSLIATSALSGNPLYLVATYEYAPGVTEIDNLSTGVRASQWINDHVQLGVTTYHQGADGASQTLKGIDGTLRYAPGTWVRFEAARANGPGTDTQTSTTGGLEFNSLSSRNGGSAGAERIEAAVDLAEIGGGMKGRISSYAQNKDAGYSAPGQISLGGEAVRQFGAAADIEVRQGTRILLKGDQRHGDLQDGKYLEAAVRQAVNPEWDVVVGARADDRSNVVPNASRILSETGSRTDVQVRAEYRPELGGGRPGEKANWSGYGYVQGTVERDPSREANNRLGAGGEVQVTDRVKLLGEASDGNLGVGGKLGADYRLSDRSNAYMTYTVESENPNVSYRGRQGAFVTGASTRVSDQLRIFGEGRMSNGAGPDSLSRSFGADWAPNDRWNYGAKVEVGTISDPLAGDLSRHAIGGSIGFKNGGVKYGGNLEYRRDVSSVTGRNTAWLMRNTLGMQMTPSWRLLGKFNLARNSNTNGAFVDGDYTEFIIAGAYRPVDNDRWNALLKYTVLNNVPSAGQVLPSGANADYAQRSQVFSVDAIYDVLPWLSVGGKYAVRIGELKAPAATGDWFSSRADLMIARADLHLVKEWDAMAELRKLRASQAQDARAGALLGIYRHMGKGVKAGVGYNFTNYSDDLTDLSYRSRGWFINVLASY